jgi:hypothetical protein
VLDAFLRWLVIKRVNRQPYGIGSKEVILMEINGSFLAAGRNEEIRRGTKRISAQPTDNYSPAKNNCIISDGGSFLGSRGRGGLAD